jgi:putative oxidoreductase
VNGVLAALGPLLGRVLLSAVFFYSGWNKFAAIGRTASSIAGRIPQATTAAYASAAFELAAAVLVVLGLRARLCSAAVIVYLALVTYLFHWHPALRGDHAQMVQVLKNAGLAGGFLLLATYGPGPASIDRR